MCFVRQKYLICFSTHKILKPAGSRQLNFGVYRGYIVFICIAMIRKTILLGLCFALATAVPASAGKVNIPLPIKAARGAATVTELANVVFAAVQGNNFEQLPLYVPTDADLSSLKKQGSEDLQAVLEEVTAATITARLQESFGTVVQEGIDKTLNLSELTLADVRTGKPSPKNKMLLPVTATLTTRANQSLRLRFEALKINGRYFLFQRLEWQAAN